MKHPTDEQWMDFLYGELPAKEKRELEQHIAECERCQIQTFAWKGTMSRLDSWQVRNPEKKKEFGWRRGAWKWAAAACLLFTSAFAAGRLSSPTFNPTEIQEQIAQPLKQSIMRELDQMMDQQIAASGDRILEKMRAEIQIELQDRIRELSEAEKSHPIALLQEKIDNITSTLAAVREEDKKLILGMLQQMEAERVKDSRTLRQELETVAVMTDQKLRQAQRQLVHLAGYTQSNFSE